MSTWSTSYLSKIWYVDFLSYRMDYSTHWLLDNQYRHDKNIIYYLFGLFIQLTCMFKVRGNNHE